MVPNWKQTNPPATGERRKLVTLGIGARTVVTVRAWTGTSWVSATDNEVVLAWDDLPAGTVSTVTTRGNGLPPNIPPAAVAKPTT